MTAPVEPSAALAACEVAVLHALEMAGKRIRELPRSTRFNLLDAGVQPFDVHCYTTAIPGECPDRDAELDWLLGGAWTALQTAYPEHLHLVVACDSYVRQLLLGSVPHDRGALRRYIEVACEAVAG